MVLFSMFLAALNIFNRFYVIAYFALFIFLVTPKRKLRFNATVLALTIFAIAITIFGHQYNGGILDMMKPFIFVICYIMGFGLIQHKNAQLTDLQQDEKKVSTAIYVMAGGTLLHFLLNWIINYSSTSRNTIDIWTNDILSATGQATLACLAVAVSIAVLFTEVGKWKKIIAIAALTLIVLYNMILAGRTLLVLITIMVIAILLYLRIMEKKKISNILLVCTSMVLVLLLLYHVNIFGMKTAVESSNLYMRFYGDASLQTWNEGTRLDHKLNFLKHLFKYPWGGGHIRSIYGHSAHDLYLDTYDDSGVFAFIAIVIYIISSIVRMVKCIRSKTISIETRVLVLCTYLVCNIEFWLEPIMRGMPWLLMAYCFIDGVVTYLLVREKELQMNMLI